jgi:hypothetical protein
MIHRRPVQRQPPANGHSGVTISQQPDTAPEGNDTDVPTGPARDVPHQRGPVVDQTPVTPSIGNARARRAWPWIVGVVIAVLLAIIAALAAALLSTTGPAAPAQAPAPAATVPTATPAPPATTTAPLPAAPPAPARAISTRGWQQIAKNPDAHIGESVIVFGHVTQFDATTGTQTFRASVDGVSHRQSYEYETNTILGGAQSTLKDLVQGDLFCAEVVVRGSTYTTTMGGSMTAPLLQVTTVRTTGSGG